MPGQFRHLIRHLSTAGGHRVICVGRRKDFTQPGVGRVTYDLPASALAAANAFLTPFENAIRHGLQVARACQALLDQDFRPDLIVAHPGWGESLYLRDVFPTVPLLHYCEFFYNPHGADTNFDPSDLQDLSRNCATRTRNAHLLLALTAGDWGISPTQWQKRQHPAMLQDRISVRFDGIDTALACPDPAARFTLPDGHVVGAGAPVVTYVARNLEPYRGFPSFMRAIPAILRALPDARIAIVGADGVSYGKRPPGGGTWRDAMMAEIADADPDMNRVHFLGPLPYADYLRLLRVSAAHVYLTVPFVLSWSMLEAMASGCVVIGSATPPVQEVIEDGQNGLLVDFFSPDAIARRVIEVVGSGARLDPIRRAARRTALDRYGLDRCLPAQLSLLDTVARRQTPRPD